MGTPLSLYQELEDQIVKEAMSKTMPQMKYWQGKTSSGAKEPPPMSAKALKGLLDKDIAKLIKDYGAKKISKELLETHILSKCDPTVISNFEIQLYKNGKTVKVTKLPGGFKKIQIPEMTAIKFGAKPMNKTWHPASKESKTMILEGKMLEVVNFHINRNHTSTYDACLACRAIRAFVQYEFHLPFKKKTTKVGKFGALTTKDLHAAKKALEETKVLVSEPGLNTLIHANPYEGSKPPCESSYKGFAKSACSCGEVLIQWTLHKTEQSKMTTIQAAIIEETAKIPQIKNVTFKEFEAEMEELDGTD